MATVRIRAHERAAPLASPRPAHARLRAPAWLLPASITYLITPSLVFAVGWTRPVVALVALAAGLTVMALAIRDAGRRPRARLPSTTMVTIWSTAVVTGLLTGAGGVAPQTWDWLKHHALLRDLVAEPWPVTYDIGGEDLGLTYYVGFHLPAAAVGKIAGWQAAHAALLTWTVLGLVLALTWFAVLIGPKAPRWLIAGFVVFSGLDAVGRVALGPLLGMADPALPSNQLDWWAVVAKYPNHLTSVMWAPHHAIAGWIGAGSILYLARTTSLRWALPVIAGCGLISPFVTIGLLPLLGYAVLAGGDQRPVDRLRSSASLPALAAAIAVGPVLLYFGARTQPLPAPFGGAVSSGFALTDPIRPIDPGRAGLAYALFVVLELGVFVALLRRSAAVQTRRAQMLLATIVATMVTIPLYRYGAWSDLAMRAVARPCSRSPSWWRARSRSKAAAGSAPPCSPFWPSGQSPR